MPFFAAARLLNRSARFRYSYFEGPVSLFYPPPNNFSDPVSLINYYVPKENNKTNQPIAGIGSSGYDYIFIIL